MSLAAYQKRVDTELSIYEKPYWHPLSQLARIIEEVGETARILNDKYGDKPKKVGEQHAELADELADIVFSIVCLANSEGIELDPALERSLNKLTDRDKKRFAKFEKKDT